MAIEVHALEPFKPLYKLPPDINIVICIGGRGGAKTYEVSKFIAFSATIRRKRCAIMRDEKSTIKESIFNEIGLRYDTANANGALDSHFVKNDSEIREKKTGKSLVFTRGFRASSNEKKANLKGISDVDIAVIEEAEDIRDPAKFNTFADSIRKEGYLIIIILNTPDINHWIVKRYFNVVQPPIPEGKTEKDIDGFFELVPKDIHGFKCIKTSYLDNVNPETGKNNLPEAKVKDYEGYGTPGHHLYDWFHYMTNIKGYASAGRKGQVLNKVRPIKLQDYLELPFKEVYGIDWGEAGNAGIVGVKRDKNTSWARQLLYEPSDVLQIAKRLCVLGITSTDVIIADSAGKQDISRLRTGWKASELSEEDAKNFPQLLKGWTIYGVIKYSGSIESGLRLMRSRNLFAVEEDEGLWGEVVGYVYAINKYGEYGDPIDNLNHLIDPWRYVEQSAGRFF